MSNKDSFVFHGEKLKLVREMQLMTLSKVSEEIGVSHQVVSAWENNKRIPSFENLSKLEALFKVPRRFFYTPFSSEGDNIAFFRKNAAVALKYQTQVKQMATMFSLIVNAFNSQVKLPKFKMPPYANMIEDFQQIDFFDIESIVENLRKELQLGIGPIPNLTLLVERLGIKVHFQDLSSAKIDAMTTYFNNQPYIIINNSRLSSVRIRFNIAHELGHIFLHSNYHNSEIKNTSNNKRIEAEANYFAGCLLLPEEGFVQDLTSTNMNHLIELKKHWKISIQAIIYRGEQLDLITNRQALFLRQQISRNKWRYFEPFDDQIKIEYPTLLNKALEYLSSENPSSIRNIINEAGITEEILRELLDYNHSSNNLWNKQPNLKLL